VSVEPGVGSLDGIEGMLTLDWHMMLAWIHHKLDGDVGLSEGIEEFLGLTDGSTAVAGPLRNQCGR